jgi:hypothetical protein
MTTGKTPMIGKYGVRIHPKLDKRTLVSVRLSKAWESVAQVNDAEWLVEVELTLLFLQLNILIYKEMET